MKKIVLYINISILNEYGFVHDFFKILTNYKPVYFYFKNYFKFEDVCLV